MPHVHKPSLAITTLEQIAGCEFNQDLIRFGLSRTLHSPLRNLYDSHQTLAGSSTVDDDNDHETTSPIAHQISDTR